MMKRNRSISRVSISSTSSINFKPKISKRAPLLSFSGTPRGSAGRGKMFSTASNHLLPRTTTVIEKKENSTDGSELDVKSDISIS